MIALEGFRANLRHTVIAAMAVLLGGMTGCHGTYNGPFCPVGPDHPPPQTVMEVQWTNGDDEAIVPGVLPDCCWWNIFGDPNLDHLMRSAAAGNFELKLASQRIAESRSLLRVAQGNLLPQTQQAFGQLTREAESINDATRVNNIQFFDSYQTGVQAAWELDFWGKYRRSIAVGEANVMASIHRRNAVMVLLYGDVATNYIRIRTAERRLEFAHQNVVIQDQALATTRARFEAGLESELDVTQAQSNLSRTKALIPNLVVQRQQSINALAVLLGLPPKPVECMVDAGRGIPQPPEAINVGIPAELVCRRPDVRAAREDLAAQGERIGIAAAELYPQISIVGAIGVSSGELSNLYTSDSLTGAIGPSFRWNILQYGRLIAAIAAEDARFAQRLSAYQQTIVVAVAEVENNLVAFAESRRRVSELQVGVQATERSIDLALELYSSGKTDFDRISNLQNFLTSLQDQLAEAEGRVAESIAKAYAALGGGWECNNEQQVSLAQEFEDSIEVLTETL